MPSKRDSSALVRKWNPRKGGAYKEFLNTYFWEEKDVLFIRKDGSTY